jgi:hypothetical protein
VCGVVSRRTRPALTLENRNGIYQEENNTEGRIIPIKVEFLDIESMMRLEEDEQCFLVFAEKETKMQLVGLV